MMVGQTFLPAALNRPFGLVPGKPGDLSRFGFQDREFGERSLGGAGILACQTGACFKADRPGGLSHIKEKAQPGLPAGPKRTNFLPLY
ncbi:MAG: hypothetical protein A3J28_08975 [Acidobacteria bacterium RIFCSPLOWO2_12_FULL_60_22]|nr:MAG: hypothetical protein A3J28_08975 [Acidobacteria bacterium RIFCSPLOWO2_12_FULL_60_22]